jgi:hypothetical protein
MSSGHCAHCGAMSTIWLPTCVFCGNSLTDPDAPKPRTQRVITLALSDTPAVGAPSRVIKEAPRKCTSRVYREKPRGEGFFQAIWAFFARLNISRR